MTNAGEQDKLVSLKTHARSAAETEASSREVALEVIVGNGQASRQTFDGHDKGLSVGFSCG
jgi:hypothetical protein